MKKLFFKIITFSVFMSMLTGITAQSANGATKKETQNQHYTCIEARGVWHRPNSSGRETTLDGLCSVLDEMAAAGINMVFLETFYHGMTVFKTNLVPYYTGFDKYSYGEYPDYLTAFCAEAEKRGIEVHAWVESFYLGVNDSTSLVKYFPDWLLVNESGSIRHTTEGASLGGYIFFDPANKDARAYLLKFYDELLTKVPGIDGLNLDYIRYPVSDFYGGTDTGYTKTAMTEFAEKYNLSVNNTSQYQDFKAQIRENSLLDEWTKYRADQVTAFIGEVSDMVNKKHPDSIISIAVHPDISSAYSQKKQDFITWIDRGYIDVVTPMVYYYNASQISSSLKTMLSKFDGVYCYSGLYTTYHSQSTTDLNSHISASNSAGADGFVLFESVKTFYDPAEDYRGFLTNKYSGSVPSALPHWSADRLIRAASDIIADKLTAGGADGATVTAITEEMERIALIGDRSAEKLDTAIEELTDLKENKLSAMVGESLTQNAEETLDQLLEHLETRRSRLSYKGYAESGEQTDDNETESPSDPTTPDQPGNDDPPKRSFIDIIKAFFESIVNWFRDLFGIEHD